MPQPQQSPSAAQIGADMHESLSLAIEAEGLRREYGGHYGLHPEFPLAQWQDAVQHQDTRLGYWEWIANAQRGGRSGARDMNACELAQHVKNARRAAYKMPERNYSEALWQYIKESCPKHFQCPIYFLAESEYAEIDQWIAEATGVNVNG